MGVRCRNPSNHLGINLMHKADIIVDRWLHRLSGRMAIFYLVIWGIIVTLPGLWTLPPLDRDETRFAQASTQMLETQDFITIRYQNEERNKKPAGIYWLQAASVALFSDVEARQIWAYRLPSVLGIIASILATFSLGCVLFDRQTGFLAGLMIASAPSLMGEATIAKTDAMLLATIASALWALAHMVKPILAGEQESQPWRWSILFWFSLVGGVFLKGPIGPMIIGLTILGLVAAPGLERRASTLWKIGKTLRPLTGMAIVLLTLLPWALAIGAATEGRFFAEALGRDMLGKFGTVQEHHAGPPGYHLVLLPVLFWPIVFLLPAMIKTAWQRRAAHNIWFLIAWMVPAWIVFELTATKLPHYVMPLYPALALLGAHALLQSGTRNAAHASDIKDQARLLFGSRIAGIGFIAIGIGVALAMNGAMALYHGAGLTLTSIIAAIAIIVMSITGYLFLWHKQNVTASLIAGTTSFLAAAVLIGYILPALDRLHLSPAISKELKAAHLHPIHDETKPATLIGYYEPSAVFLLGTQTVLTSDISIGIANLEQDHASVIVEAAYTDKFLQLAKQRGLQYQAFSVVEGINYSNGDETMLTLFRKAEPSQSVKVTP